MEMSKNESENYNNVSFLALLMAPDNSPIDDPYEPQQPPFSDCFSALPDLVSLETFPKQPAPSPPPLPQVDDYSLGTIIKECVKRAEKRGKCEAQKSKRVRIRDKMYELSKLMPAGYGRKKTMSDTLEEACKYVRFLKAQVGALEMMSTVSWVSGGGGRGNGRLERLTRQQMLQVAVNSPRAQMVLAERELCVVSVEQVALLKRVQMRKKVVQQLLARLPI
ncbi:hypothetical protein RND81_11G178000 [Saponaria officinalis]|uniref:BHLH domain-containing protein n=1 Tax=Saponaria officinalis TaxID=3572 RepID=A0AAW1HNA9_SAPOF